MTVEPFHDRPKGRVLTIAGSDSGGGAGIQADIKTVTALGGYAASAITAITVQNTLGVTDVMPVPPAVIAAQIEAVLTDIGADAIKTGMLPSVEVIETVAKAIDKDGADAALVIDPVMTAKGGAILTPGDAVQALKSMIIPEASVVTPNIPEAEELLNLKITSLDQMKKAGEAMLSFGCDAVVLKGGHMPGDTLHDVLVTKETIEVFTSPRIDTPHTHGTGCTLASAIATGLAFGVDLRDTVVRARDYVHEAIRQAPGFGQGQGPLNHGLIEIR